MNSMAACLDTEINQAKLVSQLSGRPAKVRDDIFVWNNCLLDRATAIVALLKVNNQVPVGDSIKIKLYNSYRNKFPSVISDDENSDQENLEVLARVWFNKICRYTKDKSTNEPLTKEVVRQILIDLHK